MSDCTATIFVIGKNMTLGSWNNKCDACKQPMLPGQKVYMLCHLGTPWKAEDSEDHEWAGYTWHVECDEGSLAADGAGAA